MYDDVDPRVNERDGKERHDMQRGDEVHAGEQECKCCQGFKGVNVQPVQGFWIANFVVGPMDPAHQCWMME